jgi:hypothetical protein
VTDGRPAPQYGEYATPEQQAAAMGKQYVPPVPPPVPGTRVDLAAPGSGPGSVGERPRIPGSAVDRFLTIFQLGLGLVLLLEFDYSHIAESLNAAAAQLGFSRRVPTSLDSFAWAFLAANIVLLLATIAWSYVRMRRGKSAAWVPIVGYVAFNLVIAVAVYS